MSSRKSLLLGLSGLALIAGGVLWFTRIQPPQATVTPTSAPGKPASTPATVLDPSQAASAPGKQPIAPDLAGAQDAAPEARQQPSDRRTVSQPTVAPTPTVDPAVLKPTELPPATPEIAPPKLPTLGPIEGGAAAFKSKYAGSTYAERRTRADLLEFALDNSSSPNGDKVDENVYQALKDELIWLRENMGTPPAEPK